MSDDLHGTVCLWQRICQCSGVSLYQVPMYLLSLSSSAWHTTPQRPWGNKPLAFQICDIR